MAENLVVDINPISNIKTNALLHLIKIAEKDIQNRDFEPSEKVFSDLKNEILENLG
jgi:hypothetical protein